ncbi:hypothetical protein QOZ80_2BG0206430 [Eleusine coracana subsp. coracana]|nr:hypothetical protein QOZ80_2BG0206430 [Eleusine coracana subsp. coracana]
MEMELLLEQQQQHQQPSDAASFVLSRLPHPDTAAADIAAFVGGGGSLSFLALRRGALSLASGLRLGLGLRRGDAVLIILSPATKNPLLLPQIVLGVLAAGCVVVVAADQDVEISAAAHGSGAAIIVAEPGEVAEKAAGAGVPVLLTSRSPDPRTLSVEELIEGGGDPLEDRLPSPSDVAFVAYSSTNKRVAMMTHADLIAAMTMMSHDDVLQGEGGRVCLASLPTCSVHLLALGLPAARATTVLMAPPSDPRAARDAVAAHGATDVVATPEEAAVLLAAAMPLDDKLSSLRRVVIVSPVPLAAQARLEFRRRLPTCTWDWELLLPCLHKLTLH